MWLLVEWNLLVGAHGRVVLYRLMLQRASPASASSSRSQCWPNSRRYVCRQVFVECLVVDEIHKKFSDVASTFRPAAHQGERPDRGAPEEVLGQVGHHPGRAPDHAQGDAPQPTALAVAPCQPDPHGASPLRPSPVPKPVRAWLTCAHPPLGACAVLNRVLSWFASVPNSRQNGQSDVVVAAVCARGDSG